MTAVTDYLARLRDVVQRYRAKPPELTRCRHCGSLYCGPIRCRFTLESNMGDRIACALAAVALTLIFSGALP